MSMRRITFDEVKYHTFRAGKCVVCRKRLYQRKTFMQTINPFNKNSLGFPKTRVEIEEELFARVKIWKSHLIHPDCLVKYLYDYGVIGIFRKDIFLLEPHHDNNFKGLFDDKII